MECYITKCLAGFIAFNEDLAIVNYKLFKEENIVSNLLKIENDEILEEEIELIKEIASEFDTIIIETTTRQSSYKNLEEFDKIEIKTPNKGGEYLRENLNEILLEIGFLNNTNSETENNSNDRKTREEIQKEINSKTIAIYNEVAILKMKSSSQEEDKLLIQAINSIDDIDESISKLIERIREWYTIYFPEMDTIHNNESYIKLIAESEDREDIIKNHQDAFKLDIDYSNGADINEEDLAMVKEFAKSIYSLQNSRKHMEKYIENKMTNIAPNLKELLGASLGAKLIAHVGSIKRLATFSAGTIQIMGAEKAVFRHLKTGERPPKHGLIFQHPSVRTAKWWNRGKIARTLGLKITFAVRKDVFSGEFDPTIAESFLAKVEQIEKDNPFPKKTTKRREEERDYERNKKDRKPKKYQGNKKNKRNRKKRRK